MTNKISQQLTEENFFHSYFEFNGRQAGVSLIYSHEKECYFYNSYCIDSKTVKELFSVEHEFLSEAIELINSEFESWELVILKEKESGCSSCHAK